MEQKLRNLVTVFLILALIGACGLLLACVIDSSVLVMISVIMLFVNLFPALFVGLYIEEVYEN